VNTVTLPAMLTDNVLNLVTSNGSLVVWTIYHRQYDRLERLLSI